jgi:hydroxypyruvate reductase
MIEIGLIVPVYSNLQRALHEHFEVNEFWHSTQSRATLRGIVTSASHGGADAALIESLPALEIIAGFGVGVDNIDVAAAKRRGIVVTNTPGVLNEAVADSALALLLAVTRRVCQADRYVRAGQWGKAPFPLGQGLQGKTCGILGLGGIGRCIATRVEAFGMQVAYHGRHRQEVAYQYCDSLLELAGISDVLVAAIPGGSETRALIDRAVLEALGTEGVLINIARGSVVDQPVLVEMLGSQRLGGAGLDVFIDEPHVPEELYALDNVVLLPHLGSATEETRLAMGQLTLANLKAHFEGRPALTPV